MKLLNKLGFIFGINIEQIICGYKSHEYPKDWCKMWGYKNCKKCWYIPNKNKLRNDFLFKK